MTPIAFDQSGQGPALILVIGATATRLALASLAATLAPKFTVFAYDRRGPRVRGEHPVYLAVLDPSTGRQYLLRVPPNMRTCHQAAAWIVGFDNPDDYYPIAET